ncbi:hypothetical protein GCM10020001_045100 [Nonomuraea salmonea]
MAPTYDIERLLLAQPSTRTVAGVDEVGRGAWAGPVLVCAVVTDLSEPPAGLTDSKQVSEVRRGPLAAELAEWAAGVGYGEASHQEIDTLGMTEALRRAARRALEALPVRPDAVILDGKHDYIGAPWPVRLEVKGGRGQHLGRRRLRPRQGPARRLHGDDRLRRVRLRGERGLPLTRASGGSGTARAHCAPPALLVIP